MAKFAPKFAHKDTDKPAFAMGDVKSEQEPQQASPRPVCPQNPAHFNTRVYKWGEVQYCVCDDCGTTFKRAKPQQTLPPTA